MRLRLVRNTYTTESTLGELSVEGDFECHVLEDPVRRQKIPGSTAIPAGTYRVAITHSPRFRRLLPLLEDVPGFEGIRIHAGNTAEDTDGCLLPGRSRAINAVGESRAANDALFAKIRGALEAHQSVSIEIVEGGVSPFMRPETSARGPRGSLRVSADPLRLFAQPASDSRVLAQLSHGTLVRGTGELTPAGWVHVATGAGRDALAGFVVAEFVESLPFAADADGSAASFRVNVGGLNLRSSPDPRLDANVIAALPRGQVVARLGNARKALWWEVATTFHERHLRGFVLSTLLTPLREAPAPVRPTEQRAAALGELQLGERGISLILSFEGLDQPGAWPGGMSGITLGIGYDLGFKTHDEFHGDWGSQLEQGALRRLSHALGKTGVAAKRLAPQYAEIRVKRAQAEAVFNRSSVPWIKAQTAKAFPGVQRLPLDAQGALGSLVFNRGTSMQGERRSEMRELRDALADTLLLMPDLLARIADRLRAMKRLWIGTEVSAGLSRRREAEARLVESCI